MSNILKNDTQIEILRLLSEGNSISGIARLTGAHRDTISRLMLRFGESCRRFLVEEMRDLELKHIEVDEVWTFCQRKQFNVADDAPDQDVVGDIYIWVAFDEPTRLIPAFQVDKRTGEAANEFMANVYGCLKQPKPKNTDAHAFQPEQTAAITRINTDGFVGYENAVENAFGGSAQYGQVVKNPKPLKDRKKKVASTEFIKRKVLSGNFPVERISTSLVERSNLTTRTFMKRLARRTICFSNVIGQIKCSQLRAEWAAGVS